MDASMFFKIVGAVIIANGACVLFGVAAYKANREQRGGTPDNRLSWWIYPALMIAPSLIVLGYYLAI